jgi:peptidoglycan hydrolase-like protein with peptidoglycan-binding domain
MKYRAYLLAAVLAVSACEPYAANPPPVYGGAQYETVREVQSGLTQLSYYGGPVDGIDGPETQQAILRYQGDRGLRRDGIIDDQLVSSIEGDLSARTYSSNEASADKRVSRVQSALSRLGYYDGRIDGQLDRNTRQAIVSYRRERGLQINDQIDRQLVDSLERDLSASTVQAPYPTPYPASGRFEPGNRLPGGARALLDRRWRSYEGMQVDLDRDGDLDVIARAGQRTDDCRNYDCEYVVLENRRGDYTEISAFVASDAAVLDRGTNGFSDIAYRLAGSQQQGVLRFDGRRYRG